MSRYTRRGRLAITATVEQLVDELLAAWRSDPNWPQIRAYAVRSAAALVANAEREQPKERDAA